MDRNLPSAAGRALSVSIVVCAYSSERLRLLQHAVDSLRAQLLPPSEVIVVIDHNDTLLTEVAARNADVMVIANRQARGLSGARNTGIEAAHGEIIAFIDDDAEAEVDWLQKLVVHFEDASVMGAGGAILPSWPGAKPSWFPQEFNWVIGCSYRGQPVEVAEVRNLIGCNMAFRRTAFDLVGGFSTGIGRAGSDAAGCEETEFCIKLQAARPTSKIIYDPAARVHHNISAERTHWTYFRRRCLAEGRSKRLVTQSTGTQDGLASERTYVLKTLPTGVVRGLADGVLKLDGHGFLRAGAIVGGLALTSAGYGAQHVQQFVAGRRADADFKPIRIMDLEAGQPLPEIADRQPGTGLAWGGLFLLLRKHGRPFGVLETPLQKGMPSPAELQARVDAEVAAAPTPIRIAQSSLPAASVIVATRNRTASLLRCLDSLLAQDYPNFDIIVVDNAPSSTETRDALANRFGNVGKVKYVLETRPGLGRAHNAGLAHVTAPIVAITDDDVIADCQWLSSLAGNFARDATVGCVTGLILPAELDTRAQYWTEKHGGFGKGFTRLVYDLAGNRPQSKLFPFTAGQFGSGASMAFRIDALKRIGGFDSALGAGTPARGGDDLAAFYDIVSAGYRLVYEPYAIIWHHHRRDEDGMWRQAFGYGMGLGAYLTRVVVENPAAGLRLLRVLPAGLMHMMGPQSAKTRRLPADYPATLVWRERFGIAAGVIGYLRSRLHNNRADMESTPHEMAGAVAAHSE